MDQVFEFESDTIQFVRKQYDLDKPERIVEAIIILRDWLNKQAHIVRKDYSKEYLERIIIHSKGSVERAKMKLDKIATYRTLLPQFFEPLSDPAKLSILDDVLIGFLPKLTKDHYRVFMMKIKTKTFEAGFFDYYRYFVMICEYILAQDYCNGILVVLDYTDTNIFEVIKAINVMEMHQGVGIIMDGFGMRIKGIHIITSSKTIDTLIALFKQALSAKVAERIKVHFSVDNLHEFIPKEILPRDYGGQAKSLSEFACVLKSTLGSENNMNYFKEMQHASINENYRREDKFNDHYLGIPGSFRKLNVD
ncbi:alpha-tocopherol transfer protein-like [Maniola hyperantus]|uniref:alpha-tocopherol transfer protein-like n=1 Tax=Aphantopus hyperantus TaxID=2795564 RepID=UPI001568B481|nr:alpha-tocopherol transfer protein-like [Maniola hyperantus]